MSEDLKVIFVNINDWLKYAETKNATLTAFNGAAIFGLLQAWSVMSHEIITINILLLAISSLIAIFSFTPRVLNVYKNRKITPQDWPSAKGSINVLFFGDLARLESGQFEELYRDRTTNQQGPVPFSPTGIEKDLMSQILINSEITLSKHKLFTWAVRLSLSSLLLSLLFGSHLIFDWFRI